MTTLALNALWFIERTRRGQEPARSITAPLPVRNDIFDKCFFDQRDNYIAQSAATQNGVLAPFLRTDE